MSKKRPPLQRTLRLELSIPYRKTEADKAPLLRLIALIGCVAGFAGATLLRAEEIFLPEDASSAVPPQPKMEFSDRIKNLFTPEIQEKLDASLSNKLNSTSSTRRFRNLLIAGGYTTLRHVLAAGSARVLALPGMGPRGIEMLDGISKDCPDVPFLESPGPADIARFCESLDQVPLQAIAAWSSESGGWLALTPNTMTSVSDQLAQANPPDEAVSFASAFNEAKAEIIR